MLPESFRVQFRGCLCKTERSQAQQRERESGRLGWDKLIFLVKSTAMSRSVCMTRAQICRPFLAPSRKGTDLRRFVWVSQGKMINDDKCICTCIYIWYDYSIYVYIDRCKDDSEVLLSSFLRWARSSCTCKLTWIKCMSSAWVFLDSGPCEASGPD